METRAFYYFLYDTNALSVQCMYVKLMSIKSKFIYKAQYNLTVFPGLK